MAFENRVGSGKPRSAAWTRTRLLLAGLTAAFCAPVIGFSAEAAKLDPAQVEFFEKKIRPVLATQCYRCHGAEAAKLRAGLYLDTKEGLLKGGDSGPALVPGKPEKSLLIKAINGSDKELIMPPKGERLSEEQVADFSAWIKMGAPDPRVADTQVVKAGPGIDMAKSRNHWAFKPITNPPVPPVTDAAHWGQSPVDNYILSKLKEKGLEPNSMAERRDLIRRATYDLTGLPPTTDEVAAFVKDTSNEAFAKVVDRLLASPRYGERWGRHWLDVARYADTKGDRNNGNRGDPRYPHAWTYRDYVIRSFNNDLPYNQFILEQIAADRLPGDDKQRLAALGFLTVGKRFMNNINDILDDRIDVVTQGLLGLTVSCARCHDHKFDPIPTRDYYSLHGIFSSSTEPAEGPCLEEPKDSEQYRDYLKKLAEIDDDVKALAQNEASKIVGGVMDNIANYLLVANELSSGKTKIKGNRNSYLRKLDVEPQFYDAWETGLAGWGKTKNPVFVPWFAFAALPEESFAEAAKKLAAEFGSGSRNDANPALAKAFQGAEPASLKDVAAIYGRVFGEVRKAAKEVKQGALADTGLEGVRQLFASADSPFRADERQLRRLMGNQFTNRENAIRNRATTLALSHPGAPVRAMVLEDSERPRDSRVFIRGEPRNLGPSTPRQFLEILTGDKRETFKNGSGRLELAKSIASADNPLTARVIVNRIWQHHFGEALVRSISDFGLRAELPTHPELLDHLATKFISDGWSLKKLHRYVMLSSVYQQSSKANDLAMQKDPANQYLWRMNLQRLEFESLRDTLLAVSGRIDYTVGGRPVDVVNSPSTTRRTVYGLIDRFVLPEVLRVFDFANPDMTTAQRYLTTVPQQALFMMNSPMVVEHARDVVRRADFQAVAGDEARVKFLYRLVFQREPTAGELSISLNYLANQTDARPTAVAAAAAPAEAASKASRPARKGKASGSAATSAPKTLDSWERFAQVMLLSNEFVFVN